MTVTSLLQELVRIPSVNPDAVPASPHSGEEAMAQHLAHLLTSWGFAVTLDEVQPGRPNLIARAPGPEDRPRIFFGPHLDTVAVDGMTIDPFSGEEKDGCIWGRGASDTKGPMAAMLCALHHHRDRLAELPVAVDFVAFMGEESHQPGAKHFARHQARDYEFALVGEPTSLQFVRVTKGSLWATVRTTGKATHASQPHLGENAILKLTASLDLLNRKLTNRLATYQHPVLGHSTLNIGTIAGGSSANIVPDHAEATLDIRFTPDLAAEGGARQLVEQLIAENQLPLTFGPTSEAPPMEVKPDHPWLQRLTSALPEGKLVGAPWFSDAAHLNAAGLPAVCIGPGSIDQAHTADEFITISDLEKGADFFKSLIASLEN
ncbi:M20 family metallopeptidase [Roseibacillus ishigakijimensis]|uniref:M20 family metallopeptidase n=1 Tax=Roseibacillus ishigakijimensis TaxID=454146 RepID=A0A934RSA1_9BACT|nr:M20 family metallopeptidase [Roseibacillus ishigakijimensis]MBK1834099.1 M20 family metallopeptidase [Roseibacillus ishigakijimensis]